MLELLLDSFQDMNQQASHPMELGHKQFHLGQHDRIWMDPQLAQMRRLDLNRQLLQLGLLLLG
jgi:hypothetical protein